MKYSGMKRQSFFLENSHFKEEMGIWEGTLNMLAIDKSNCREPKL